MLSNLIEFLACPVCGEELAASGGSLACANRHTFDVARQGYVNLLLGSERPGTADTSEMVRARAEFLAGDLYAPIAAAVADAAAEAADTLPGCLLDVGAGTGYYLAAALDRMPDRVGLALDISKEAARVAARTHPRMGAVVADTWRTLPVRDGVAAVVLDVFAPRNFEEFSRVLTPGGALIVATPTERHLRELVDVLALLSVDERKADRLRDAAAGLFEAEREVAIESTALLSHSEVTALVGMGPSARHAPEDLQKRIAELPEPFTITISTTVASYRSVA